MAYYKVLDDVVVMGASSFTGSTSATVAAIVAQAISSGLALVVRPGNYAAGDITINGPISVRGVPGKVTFTMTANAKQILRLSAFTKADFFGVTFNGNNVAFTYDPTMFPSQGLVNVVRDSTTLVSQAAFEQCVFQNSTKGGVGVDDCRVLIDECEFKDCDETSLGILKSDQVSVRASRFENQDIAIHMRPAAVSNVTIEGNVIRGCATNGIAVEPSGSSRISGHMAIIGNTIGKLNSGDAWAVSRSDPASTGAEGNGILVYLADNVVIQGNDIGPCQFSSIRTNASSKLTIFGNVCRNAGEVALFVECAGPNVGEYGATIVGNTIDGGGNGISVTNFNNGGHISTVSGNVIRNIDARTITYSGGSYGTSGAGVHVEADAAVSGNMIQTCYFGMTLGTNDYTSDLNASGNIIRDTTLGIAVSNSTPKEILLSGNLIAGYSSGAIKAYDYSTSYGTPPANIVGAELCPANRGSAASGKINMIGNVRRATL